MMRMIVHLELLLKFVDDEPQPSFFVVNNHLEACVDSGLDGVDLRHNIIDQELVEQCHASGLDVWCWTVNDTETAQKMKELGVSAITTDRPAWLKNNLLTQN